MALDVPAFKETLCGHPGVVVNPCAWDRSTWGTTHVQPEQMRPYPRSEVPVGVSGTVYIGTSPTCHFTVVGVVKC